MLTERYLASLSDELVELYSVLEYEIKRDMVKRLAKLQKITDATKWSAQIFNEVGGLRSNIDKYVKQYDFKAQSMIKKLFYEALEKNEASDLKYISSAKRKLNANQQQVLNAKLKALEQAESVVNPKDAVIDKLYARFYKKYQYDDVFRSIKRMTMTIADTSQEEFIRECNNAYMKVTSGGFSYQQALKQGVDQLATAPVKTVFYSQSGSLREFSIEAALRMNILTGVNQVASQQTLDNAEEIGVDKYEVSAHIGARWSKYAQNAWSNHSEWQGKIYTREQLETVCGLGYADGLCGINCRHSFYPYIPGTPRLYTKEALEKMNDKTVELYGKKVSQYEAEQELRKTERAIRACKRKAGCEAEVGIDNTKARVRLGELQKQARDICQKAGIKRDYSREYVGTKTGDQVRSLKIVTSGGRTYVIDPKIDTKEVIQAKNYYEEIYNRKGKGDAKIIAEKNNLNIKDVLAVRDHVFNGEFFPDKEIAASWQRLTLGKANDIDMLLFNHELEEQRLMKQGMDYKLAHLNSNLKYPWEYKIHKKWKDKDDDSIFNDVKRRLDLYLQSR